MGIDPMTSQIPAGGSELGETYGELGHFTRLVCGMCPAYIADPSSIWEAMGLIPFRDSNFFL